MTDLNKLTPQQYEQYCINFHLSINALPTDIINSYRSCCTILEIEPGSNSETIQDAYKRLCKLQHSDKLSGSTEAMQALVTAKEMLSAYIELSDGNCHQPFTSSKRTYTATATQTNLMSDLSSFSPRRIMTLRVVSVLARQHINIAKFTGRDFFAAQLQTIDDALRMLLERMKELLAFPFQFSSQYSIEDVNREVDVLLNQYHKTNEVGRLIIHRALASLFMFFTAIKRINSYFENILSDQIVFHILELLARRETLLLTQSDKKIERPDLLFFHPPDGEEGSGEEKPLLPAHGEPDQRETVSWWRRTFCC